MHEPLRVTRFVSEDDPNNYMERDVQEGEILYLYEGHTYGCVEAPHPAVSVVQGQPPFYQFPYDAVVVLTGDEQMLLKDYDEWLLQQPRARGVVD